MKTDRCPECGLNREEANTLGCQQCNKWLNEKLNRPPSMKLFTWTSPTSGGASGFTAVVFAFGQVDASLILEAKLDEIGARESIDPGDMILFNQLDKVRIMGVKSLTLY